MPSFFAEHNHEIHNCWYRSRCYGLDVYPRINVLKDWSSGAAVEKWRTIWTVKPFGTSLGHQRDACEGDHRILALSLHMAYC